MLGLVVSGKTKASTLNLWFRRFFARKPLELELRERGVPILPLDRVDAFMREKVREWEVQGREFHARWERSHFPLTTLDPPPKIVDRIRSVSGIKGRIHIYAMKFVEDPLLFVEKDHIFGLPEKACIGGWNTGSIEFDV